MSKSGTDAQKNAKYPKVQFQYQNNSCFIFLPFSFGKGTDFADLCEAFRSSGIWRDAAMHTKYLFRYVSERLQGGNGTESQAVHFRILEERKEEFGFGEGHLRYVSGRDKNRKQTEAERGEYVFRMIDAEVFLFNTHVGILAIRIQFQENDPLMIASAQFHIKKVSKVVIYTREGNSPFPDRKTFSFLDIGKLLTDPVDRKYPLAYFFFAQENGERANMLSLIETDHMENCRRDLFYLRRCYERSGFHYVPDEKLEEKEVYYASDDTVWGITEEAAACLICRGMNRSGFLEHEFFTNFHTQYLFVYVLLLHQKYVLYRFLTVLSSNGNSSLKELEEYKYNLEALERDFVFTRITEVPQYQNLYNRLVDAFSLKDMYQDVYEPITSLTEQKRIRSENKLNQALLFLSVLGLFSALVDGFDFVDHFFNAFAAQENQLPEKILSIMRYVQVVVIGIVALIAVYVILTLLSTRRDRTMEEYKLKKEPRCGIVKKLRNFFSRRKKE